MTSNTPNPHQHILERRLPAWAREATPEHWQRLPNPAPGRWRPWPGARGVDVLRQRMQRICQTTIKPGCGNGGAPVQIREPWIMAWRSAQ